MGVLLHCVFAHEPTCFLNQVSIVLGLCLHFVDVL